MTSVGGTDDSVGREHDCHQPSATTVKTKYLPLLTEADNFVQVFAKSGAAGETFTSYFLAAYLAFTDF